MKKYSSFFLFLFVLSASIAQTQFKYKVNLSDCLDDELKIELAVSAFKETDVVFRLPKIVPGTYEIYDFGRFVSNFKAFDFTGNELKVEAVDKNSWKIKEANKLAKINYQVEDTWDTENKESFVFEPGGSNFEADKVFVLNTHCLFGYFDGYIKNKIEVKIMHPQNFSGACSLTDVVVTDSVDTYQVANYMDLQDAPMMYNVPDTTVLTIGGAQILISLYSPNKVTTSKFIAKNISEILEAQKMYLGGSLPIKKYAYLIYLSQNVGGSGASGALEHSYSSLYFLPEMPEEYLIQTIKDVSAHEFFHIVTPLSIHSEEIGNFDYNNPKMSKHLWLYEGVTEYAASLVQVKYGKMTIEEYIGVIEEKMYGAKNYNDSLPFTVMSEGCLDKYKEQYGNVYEKGALLGMCLDIQLRLLSKGNYGVQELMKDLALQYGKEKSFKDDELFDKIVALTYPEIGDFFKNYVAGDKPLPIYELLKLAGIGLGEQRAEKYISFGGFDVTANPESNRLIIVNTLVMDPFGKALGYMEDDELIKFNGKKINLNNAQKIIQNFFDTAKEGDVFKAEVSRKTEIGGKKKKVKLKAQLFLVEGPITSNLMIMNTASQEQVDLRKAWLGKIR